MMTARTISNTPLLPSSEGQWYKIVEKNYRGQRWYEATEELAKLILLIEKSAKITRKEKNIIRKIQQIRDTIQDSVLYAKLKKSIKE